MEEGRGKGSSSLTSGGGLFFCLSIEPLAPNSRDSECWR
jgi:hypothetical protein